MKIILLVVGAVAAFLLVASFVPSFEAMWCEEQDATAAADSRFWRRVQWVLAGISTVSITAYMIVR